jgi:HEAT repeat protein
MFGSKMSKIEKLTAKKKSGKLVKYLNDKDGEVRLAAIKGLGQAGGEAAFNSLISLLRDSNADTRKAAASALEELNDDKSIAALNAHQKTETDDAVKEAMRRAIKAIQIQQT